MVRGQYWHIAIKKCSDKLYWSCGVKLMCDGMLSRFIARCTATRYHWPHHLYQQLQLRDGATRRCLPFTRLLTSYRSMHVTCYKLQFSVTPVCLTWAIAFAEANKVFTPVFTPVFLSPDCVLKSRIIINADRSATANKHVLPLFSTLYACEIWLLTKYC